MPSRTLRLIKRVPKLAWFTELLIFLMHHMGAFFLSFLRSFFRLSADRQSKEVLTNGNTFCTTQDPLTLRLSDYCGQYYKQITSINYDSSVLLTRKFLYHDSRVVNYDRILVEKIMLVVLNFLSGLLKLLIKISSYPRWSQLTKVPSGRYIVFEWAFPVVSAPRSGLVQARKMLNHDFPEWRWCVWRNSVHQIFASHPFRHPCTYDGIAYKKDTSSPEFDVNQSTKNNWTSMFRRISFDLKGSSYFAAKTIFMFL